MSALNLTDKQFKALQTGRGEAGAKFGNRSSPCGFGHLHPSVKERNRCVELHLRQRGGDISDLQYEPIYRFEHNGVLIGTFRPDFRYYDRMLKRWIVEDVKGGAATKTTAYRLRVKMLKAFHGITVVEV